MKTFAFVDLFCGIGGFHLALTSEPLDGTCLYACDIDPDCRDVYQAAFKVTHWGGNIREITEPKDVGLGPSTPGLVDRQITSQIPAHDLLTAGFPCQPFSKSGRQRGIDETRGTLFYDILRVLQVRQPQFILLENVMNLVGPRHKETWRTIVSQLRGLGYATSDAPTVLSPHALPIELGGRPQHRQRVFIPALYVGAQASEDHPLGPLVDPLPCGSPPSWNVSDFLDSVTAEASAALEVRPEQVVALEMWDELVQAIPGRIPGIPLWADTWRGLLVRSPEFPDWKNKIIEANLRFYQESKHAIDGWLGRHPDLGGLYASYRKLEWQVGPGKRDIWAHAIQFRPSGIRVRPLTYLPALVAINQTSIIGPLGRRISIREAARLQGFPDGFPFQGSPASRYRQLGNAVSVGVTHYVARALLLGTAGEPGEQAPLAWIATRRASDAAMRGRAELGIAKPSGIVRAAEAR